MDREENDPVGERLNRRLFSANYLRLNMTIHVFRILLSKEIAGDELTLLLFTGKKKKIKKKNFR